MSHRAAWRFSFTGWVLFTVSAVLFLYDTWRSADVVGVLASLAFLIACGFFMVPAWRLRPRSDD